MSDYKLSIITINYNNLKGLEDTFKSVFEQTWQDFEYIVIDGGSTDGSRELIEKHSDKIHYWVSEPDKGIYNALNKGVVKARGEYILCLNSGDSLYETTTLEQVVPELGSREDIIYGNICIVNDNEMKEVIYPNIPSWNYLRKKGLGHPATFIRDDLYNKVGLYDENYKIVSDWKFMLLAFSKFGATSKYLNFFISNFDGNGISSKNVELRENERNEILHIHFKFYIQDDEVKGYDEHRKELKTILKGVLKFVLPYGIILLYKKKYRRCKNVM